ncbi:hypothetical protein [Ammoniphilus sp. YIM 78166]|uniref:hypothetical protein n=1 Tax=Ammoniphilus sp. YIM 78166 TaxID=1644106 RepID=UPI00142F64AF|nr:hypothetical protein [Ammoniphilus sp. YIM 78166]
MRSRSRQARHEGFKQGMWTTLLLASPFIVAGAKWMMENADPMVDRVKNLKKTDLYTQFFDEEAHEEKTMNRKLSTIRSGEGNFGNHDVEVAKENDEALFQMFKEIAKKELSKK